MHKEEKTVNLRCEFSEEWWFLILRILSNPRNPVSCDALCMDGYFHFFDLAACFSLSAPFAHGHYFLIFLPSHEPSINL